MRQGKIKHPALSLTGLRHRGWTPDLIDAFLGEPDEVRANPFFTRAAPMRLYALERIEAAEQLPSFAEAKAKASASSRRNKARP